MEGQFQHIERILQHMEHRKRNMWGFHGIAEGPPSTDEKWLWYYTLYQFILTCNVFLNVFAGIMTGFVMIRLNIYKSKIMRMVFFVTLIELCYDALLLDFCSDLEGDDFYLCKSTREALLMCCGMAVSSLTALIVLTIAYVVMRRRATHPSLFMYFIMIVIPALIVGAICFSLSWTDHHSRHYEIRYTYDSWRLIMILISFVAMSVIFFRLWKLRVVCIPKAEQLTEETTNSNNYPLFVLASRLIGYPVIHVIQRLACSSYLIYSGDLPDFYLEQVEEAHDETGKSPNVLTALLLIWAVFAPCGGIGDFLVFLQIQIGAWEVLKYYYFLWLSVLTCGYVKKRDKPLALFEANGPSGIENIEQEHNTRVVTKFTTKRGGSVDSYTIRDSDGRSQCQTVGTRHSSIVEELTGMRSKSRNERMERVKSIYFDAATPLQDQKLLAKTLNEDDLLDIIVQTSGTARRERGELELSITNSTASFSEETTRNPIGRDFSFHEFTRNSSMGPPCEDDTESDRESSVGADLLLIDVFFPSSDTPGVAPTVAASNRRSTAFRNLRKGMIGVEEGSASDSIVTEESVVTEL